MGGFVLGDCLSFQLRSLLFFHYHCFLSFINCFAICSRPRWLRSIEALTGTSVSYKDKVQDEELG